MEDAETRKETNPKKKNETKWKKDSINSAKIWIKNEEKVNKIRKHEKGKHGRAKTEKKQRGPKNMFDFGVFFVVEDDLRSWSLTFFSEKKKSVVKKWKKETKWKMKRWKELKCVLWWFVVHEIDNTLLLVCFSVHFQSNVSKTKCFVLVFGVDLQLLLFCDGFQLSSAKNMRFVIFVFFWKGGGKDPWETQELDVTSSCSSSRLTLLRLLKPRTPQACRFVFFIQTLMLKHVSENPTDPACELFQDAKS